MSSPYDQMSLSDLNGIAGNPAPVCHPPYQYIAYAQKPIRDPSKNWVAMTGLVAGIVSILIYLYCWVDIFFIQKLLAANLMNILYAMSFFGGIAGIVFSSIGLRSEQRKMAVIGLICSIGYFAIRILLPAVIVFYLLLSI